MCKILIEAVVRPTEDIERVRRAVLTMFPEAELVDTGNEGLVRGTASALDHFVDRLAEQRIRDSARNVLGKCARNGALEFYLNKQAALMDRVNFTDGDSPLGDIRVTVKRGDPEVLVCEWTSVSAPGGRTDE